MPDLLARTQHENNLISLFTDKEKEKNFFSGIRNTQTQTPKSYLRIYPNNVDLIIARIDTAKEKLLEDKLTNIKSASQKEKTDSLIQLADSALAHLGLYQNSLETCLTIKRIHPQFELIDFNIAIAQENLKQYSAAIANYKRAMKWLPNDESLFEHLATASFYNKNYEESIYYLNQALAVSEDTNPSLYWYMGLDYYCLGKPGFAVTSLRQLSHISKADGENSLLLLYLIAKEAGHEHLADDYLQQGIMEKDTSYWSLKFLQYYHKDFSLIQLSSLCKDHFDSLRFNVFVGLDYLFRGDKKTAQSYLKKVENFDDPTVSAYHIGYAHRQPPPPIQNRISSVHQ